MDTIPMRLFTNERISLKGAKRLQVLNIPIRVQQHVPLPLSQQFPDFRAHFAHTIEEIGSRRKCWCKRADG